MDPSPLLIPEAEAATALGVPRDLLRALRKTLSEPEHFIRREGREVLLTPSGIHAVTLALMPQNSPEKKEAAVSTLPGDPEAVAGAAGVALLITATLQHAPPPPTVLVVVSIPRNPRILLAKKEGAATPATPLRVRVKDNRKFVPGMKFPAIPITGEGGLWRLACRHPRHKGRF